MSTTFQVWIDYNEEKQFKLKQSLSKKIKDKVHCYWMNSKRKFLIIQSLTQYQKLHISFLSVMLGLKEDKNTHKDKASSNQTPALTKSTNMGI